MNAQPWFPVLRTVGLLLLSNVFMTAAWYGHLRFRAAPMIAAIIGSWLLALPEYALQVPANRLGYGALTAYQLKILQECITLVVFIGFAWLYLGETPHWRYMLSFILVLTAVVVAFGK
jgi:uncharacterized protein (DUF486 family)